jgi:ATP-dependent Lon protease
VKKGMTIIPVATVDELLKHALVTAPVPIEWTEEGQQIMPSKPAEERPGVITH